MARLAMVFLTSITAAAAAQAPDIRVVRDQADAALAILQRSGAPTQADWDRLTRSEGYHRLLRREAAMGRPLTDSAFRAFLLSDTMARRAPLLARTLEEWSRADAGAAARLALAYLPGGTRLQATVYPLIKPRVNSFVFDTGTDSAAIASSGLRGRVRLAARFRAARAGADHPALDGRVQRRARDARGRRGPRRASARRQRQRRAGAVGARLREGR
jgi:hypothetical protein